MRQILKIDGVKTVNRIRSPEKYFVVKSSIQLEEC